MLEVRPVYDGVTEKEGVRLSVTGTSDATVAVLPPTDVAVTIYDGPRYTLIELPGNSYSSSMTTYGLNQATLPSIVGYEYMQKPIRWDNSGSGWYFSNLPNNQYPYYPDMVPYGISDLGRIAGRVTGGSASRAYRFDGSVVLLDSFNRNAGASAISPSGSRIVGWHVDSLGYTKGIRWRSDNNWTPENLLSLYEFPGQTRHSYAYGVNDSGEVVGTSQNGYDSYHAVRTGTTDESRFDLYCTDLGLLPATPGDPNPLDENSPTNSSAAVALNKFGEAVGGSHIRVFTGSSWVKQYRAAYRPITPITATTERFCWCRTRSEARGSAGR